MDISALTVRNSDSVQRTPPENRRQGAGDLMHKPLAYRDPDRIVTLSSLWRKSGGHGQVSAPDFHDWHDQSTAFAAMAYYEDDSTAVMSGASAQYAHVAEVTPEFFQVFAYMTRTLTILLAIAALAVAALAAGKKLALKDLPAAAQKTVQDQVKDGSISKETENGVEQYEVETMLNGKHRDLNVDTKGNLLVVEEETSIDTIPAAAKAAMEKKAAGGKIAMVELFIRGNETLYEAAYTGKDGKKHEALFKADGTETKE